MVITSLDLSSFDTSNVTDMNNMFSQSFSLTSINVSSWDTSKVTNMEFMFATTYALISLDLSTFDTSKVVTMKAMFGSAIALETLDISNFNTGNVTDMSFMFFRTGKDTELSLDISSWCVTNITSEPTYFAVRAAGEPTHWASSNLPVWGTCP